VSNVRASMGVGVLVGLTLSVLLMLTATAPAQAHTLTDCQAEINQLKSLTDDATFLGKKATTAEDNLLFKLDEANEKLEKGKYQDAIDKLTDFKTTVIARNEGGKIDPNNTTSNASVLIAEADEAITCVEGLQQAQATTAA
jgi:hypothetical protein